MEIRHLWSFGGTLRTVLPGAAVLLLARGVAGQCAGCPNASFGTAPRSHFTPAQPYSLTVGDFNGDGSLDVAVVGGWSPATVSVWLGTPEGRLGSPVSHTVPGANSPYPSLVTADFDGDGRLDLLFSAWSSTLFFLHGVGDGTFSAAVPISTAKTHALLATGDFNGDGIPDIATTDDLFAGNNVNILTGNGAGGFYSPITIPAGPQVVDLRMGDLNGDGLADIVTANQGSNTISVIFGVAMGPVAPARATTVGVQPRSLAFGDWNRDGKLDLAVANGGLTLLAGDGAGGFQPPAFYPASFASRIAAGDFNGDGNPDIAAVTTTSGLALMAGDGSGALTVQPSMGSGPNLIVAADMNRDGMTDLVGATGTEIMVFFGSAGSPPLSSEVYPGSVPTVLAAADFNGDGKPDIAGLSSYQVTLLLSMLGRDFTPGTPLSLGYFASFVAAADLNHDGRADLIVGNTYASTVEVFLGNGDGTFGSAASFPVGGNPVWISVVDLNGNDKPDLLVANSSSNTVSVLLGKGDGTFLPQTQFSVGSGPNSIAVADFNRDGKPDIAVSNAGSSTVALLLGDGSGGFSSISLTSVGASPASIVADDFNGDNKPDCALLTGSSPRALTILLGNGSGGLAPPTILPVPNFPGSLATADFNLDGKPDLVAAGSYSFGSANSPAFYVNDGAGGFLPPLTYFAGLGMTSPAIADFDLDGLPDVAIGLNNYFSSSGVAVLRNTNCKARRLGLPTDLPGCPNPGSPFAPQPTVTVLDDGDNLVQCDSGLVTAAIAPGTGTPGAVLGGTPSVFAITGEAFFSDLSVNLPGLHYRLRFTHAGVGSIESRSFSQGVAPAISGPAALCDDDVGIYDAGPGYDSYQWTLDASPIGRTRKVSLGGLSAGAHALAVTVTSDGCSPAPAGFTVTSNPAPSAVLTAPSAVCPYSAGGTASVPDAGAGASYVWSLTNGAILTGAGTRAITFRAGPWGSVAISVTVTNAQGCSAASAKMVTIDPTLSCPSPVGFFTLPPCRVLDTRNPNGPLGGPSLIGGSERTFVLAGSCGIPATATAVSANIAETQAQGSGHLRIYPAGSPLPNVSVINFSAGQTRANNAILPLGPSGDINVYVGIGSGLHVDFILDVNGYFQ